MDRRTRGRFCSLGQCARIAGTKGIQSIVVVSTFITICTILNSLYTSNQEIKKKSDSHELYELIRLTRSNGIVFYDHTKPLKEDSVFCKNLQTEAVTPISLPEKGDPFLQGDYTKRNRRESSILARIQTILRSDQSYGLIDVGDNLGNFGIIAAKVGHSELAVEPLNVNVLRLHKAAKLAYTGGKILLLKNDVSNFSTSTKADDTLVYIDRKDNTKPPIKCRDIEKIHLDDLVEYITFQKAILKLNIGLHDIQVIKKASRLFREIDIPFVFMGIQFSGIGFDSDNVTNLMKDMLAFFTERSYTAYDPFYHKTLNQSNNKVLPDAILWIRKGKKYPF